MSLGLTVGNLRALWATLPDDAIPVVSFAGVEGLVVRSAGADHDTGGAYMTVGPITPRDVQRLRGEH